MGPGRKTHCSSSSSYLVWHFWIIASQSIVLSSCSQNSSNRKVHDLPLSGMVCHLDGICYLIAKTVSLAPNGKVDDSTPSQDWYNHLFNKHNFSEAWLDSLRLSSAANSTGEAHVLGLFSNGQRRTCTINLSIGFLSITFCSGLSGPKRRRKLF